MIARLHGHVLALEDGAVVVDVAGVAFRVQVPATQLADLGPVGSPATLHTYLMVRETELELFGATDAATLAVFRQLLSVGGVGPRLALAILSSLDAPSVQQAIVGEDIERLVAVPGVGRKTAQRIVLDLKSRLEAAGVTAAPGGRFAVYDPTGADADALAALVALGYNRGEARRALAGLPADPAASVEDRVVAALRQLAP